MFVGFDLFSVLVKCILKINGKILLQCLLINSFTFNSLTTTQKKSSTSNKGSRPYPSLVPFTLLVIRNNIHMKGKSCQRHKKSNSHQNSQHYKAECISTFTYPISIYDQLISPSSTGHYLMEER